MTSSDKPQYLVDFDGTFFRGVKSDVDPSQLPLGYAWTAVNLINLGGVLSTRPGHRCIVRLPDGNLQGAHLFRPLVGMEQLVVGIDGIIYVAEWPFTEFRMLTNVQFSPHARQLYWAQTTQSAYRVTDDFSAKISVMEPRAVLFIQDGGHTAPAYYDGSMSGHVRDKFYETPAGGPMCWVGDRLWAAVGNQVLASDISNPFSFREEIYLGGVSAFFFQSEVTAMTPTPSIESPQLMVFTEVDGSILQANVRSRDLWPTTEDFQREIVQVGCLSQRSIMSHYGRLVWFSPSGISFFDPALSGKITTRLPVRDNEMLISKASLSEDLGLVAGACYGQFLLMSVPAEDIFNKHTWVLNHASLETLSDDSGPSWSGLWLGTRPVEWIYGTIAGAERIYHVSSDADGGNRLWESFIPDRLDNGCPITCGFSTRGYFGQTAPVQSKLPGQPCKMCWADAAFTGITEDLDVGAFYAGGTRGAFRPMMAKKVKVERGSLSPNAQITSTTEIFAFKAQSRTLRTEDVSQQNTEGDSGTCSIESEELDGVDESFQLFFVWHGPATVRWVRAFAQAMSEDWSGDPAACVSETEIHGLRYDGFGATGADIQEVITALAAAKAPAFVSNQVATCEQDGISATGIGSAESLVSQDAADRVAGIIAQKTAENEVAKQLPKVLSSGLGLE
jgi:hypothetical protein